MYKELYSSYKGELIIRSWELKSVASGKSCKTNLLTKEPFLCLKRLFEVLLLELKFLTNEGKYNEQNMWKPIPQGTSLKGVNKNPNDDQQFISPYSFTT